MRAVVRFFRFLLAWVYTLLVAGTCCLFLFVPRWAWLTFCRPWARGSLWIVGVNLEVDRKDRLRGPAVFISNHQSLIDVVFMPAILPRTIKFVAKKELRRIPLWGWAFAAGGGLMIDRSDPRGAIAAIRDGLQRVPPDWSVAVFPEGTRSRDGSLGRFKKGAFHIAMQRGLPIVPVGMWGARDVVPKGAWMLRAATVYVTVGQPMVTDDWSLATIEEHAALGRRRVEEAVELSRQRWQAARQS
jgi:1-acyl-sn-glycerol-3-phosphate acyltransferase